MGYDWSVNDLDIELSIVVPVYSEEDSIAVFHSRLLSSLQNITNRFEVIYCLDPSPDKTEEIITSWCEMDKRIALVKFSRRFGQPAATIAGIKMSNGSKVAVIDADLQDPPEILIEMYRKILDGYDVAYGERISRRGETHSKKFISTLGYKLINSSSEVAIPPNVGDFRMMSRRVVNQLNLLTEAHGFLRGLVAYVGFPQIAIKYEREERISGFGKYNRYLGSLKIGLNGLIGFSSKPLVFMSVIGALISGSSFIVGTVYLIQKLLGFSLNPGLPTLVILVTFLSGVQISALGLIGQYISRIYDEVKSRPMYIIDSIKNLNPIEDK